jgi:2-polyprenyl-3-methyl-5-hydroxy-6-metoxy-1,4-benzoquinol methylase
MNTAMNTALTQVFERIYKEDTWTSGSGPGSQPSNVQPYIEYLSDFVINAPVRSILDIGCGDWSFTKTLNLTGVEYLGLDIVDSVITKNRLLYGTDSIKFLTTSATGYKPLFTYDLIIIKDVMQHLSYKHCQQILNNINGGYRYLIITNDFTKTNIDCGDGEWRPLNITLEPFNFTPFFDFQFNSVPLPKHTVVIKSA